MGSRKTFSSLVWRTCKRGSVNVPVKSNGADVEHTGNGNVGSQTDQIDCDTPKYGNPDGQEWNSGETVHLGPDLGKWDEAVTGKGEDCTCQCLL